MQSSYTFELDGETFRVDGESVTRSLSNYLHALGLGRESRFRRPDPWLGGAPLLLLDIDGRGRPALRSIDAASLPLITVAGRRLWSAEGILRQASSTGDRHPVLEAMDAHPYVECTWAGRARILTALLEGYYRHDLQLAGQLTDQLDGCLSRTVHYEALKEMAGTLFSTAQQRRHEAEQRAQARGLEEDFQDGKVDVFGDAFSALLAGDAEELDEFHYVDQDKRRFYRPQTIVDLAKLLAQYPKATLVGGATSIPSLPEGEDWDCLISTEGVGDLRALYDKETHWDIGAATPLTAISEVIGRQYPALSKVLRRFGNRFVRNRVNLGGCLGAAKADDEITPTLIALDGQVRVISMDGERDVPIARFFEGKGKTNLRPTEVIADVILPRFTGAVLKERGCQTRFTDAYKAAPTRETSGDQVGAAFSVELDQAGKITKSWIAYSGLADRPLRIRKAEEAMTGKPWSEDTLFTLLPILSKEVGAIAPLDRPPAGMGEKEAAYRKQLVITLFQKFFYQHPRSDGPPVELGRTSEVLKPNRRFYQPAGSA